MTSATDDPQAENNPQEQLGGLASRRGGRVTSVLYSLTLVIGVATAAFIASAVPVPDPAEQWGGGAVFLFFFPTLLAAIPLAVPSRARVPIAIVIALILSVLTLVAVSPVLGFIGWFYLPMACAMWAAAVVPWWMRRGISSRAAWWLRTVGGIVVALPSVAVIAGLLAGAFLMSWGTVAVAILGLLLSVGYAIGSRVVAIVIAVGGAALMIGAAVDPGFFALAAWWMGGAWLVIAAVGLVLPLSRRP